MNNLIKALFILLPLGSFAQNPPAVLIIPMKQEAIDLDRKVRRMLGYNQANMDSVKNRLVNLSVSRAMINFPGYAFINALNDATPNSYSGYLTDSTELSRQWNSYHNSRINESKGVERVLLYNDNSRGVKYDGRIMEEKELNILRSLFQTHNLKYVFFINNLETIHRPFSSKSFVSLHFEIYDQNLNKIYGDKSYLPIRIRRVTYSDIFEFFVKNAMDEYYKGVARLFIPKS